MDVTARPKPTDSRYREDVNCRKRSRVALLLAAAAAACVPSQEAESVRLQVAVDGSQLGDVVNDLGYEVHLEAAKLAIGDVGFTISGEMHGATASLWRLVVPTAWAHPGHYAGGDVTGVMSGMFVADFLSGDGATLGEALLIVGDYNGANIDLRVASDAEDVDPLKDHTAYFAGTARRGGQTIVFTAALDVDAGVQVVGAPFEDTITVDSQGPLRLQLIARDPTGGLTLFDGLDFAALDGDGDGQVAIVPGDAAHNVFRRALATHVFYDVVAP